MTFHERSAMRAFAPQSAFAQAEPGSPYGWMTPYIAAIAAHTPQVGSRILSLSRTEMHFIALCLSLMGEKRNDADHLAAFAGGIGIRTRKSLLGDLAPDANRHLAQLTGKLAGRPWRPASYLRLTELYAEPHARKVLCHIKQITRWRLIILARLPAPYRKIGIVIKIKKRLDLSSVLFGIEVVRRVRTDLNDRQILASLEKSDTRYVRDWVEAHYERLPFPQAPTGALTNGTSGVLRPVTSGADLLRAGREFDNCVANYMWEASTGASVFYRYDDSRRPVAIAELKRLAGGLWAVDEMMAPKNKTLDGKTRQEVLAAFTMAGILPAPQVTGSFSWFDLD